MREEERRCERKRRGKTKFKAEEWGEERRKKEMGNALDYSPCINV